MATKYFLPKIVVPISSFWFILDNQQLQTNLINSLRSNKAVKIEIIIVSSKKVLIVIFSKLHFIFLPHYQNVCGGYHFYNLLEYISFFRSFSLRTIFSHFQTNSNKTGIDHFIENHFIENHFIENHKVDQKLVVDHFVERQLGCCGILYYLWRIIYSINLLFPTLG